MVIPTSSPNLDTDLTEALRLAGVTEEGAAGLKEEVLKKAGLESGGSSRGKKAATAGASVLHTQGQPTSREEKKHSAGGKRASGSSIGGPGHMKKSKLGVNSVGSGMLGTPTTKSGGKKSSTSSSLQGTGLSSSSFSSVGAKKSPKKKKKGSEGAGGAGAGSGAKNVNINIINVQNDFQISNQIIIQSGAPGSAPPFKSPPAEEEEKK